ncbi:MAG: enoyl-CoA hydratase/isomerase family protein [Actinobacteria bacterium]|nr:enoyl-CoA hydratase/isomerase family protein [Actinomycetota bacterium]
MTEQLVAVERRDGLTALTVDRPHKRNALSREVLDDLRAALVEAASDETLRVLTITGAGQDNFTSGGDLVALSAVRTRVDASAMACHARTVLDHIRTFPVPVVAAVNGDALGGGAELAVACDFRIVASHARLGFVQGRQAITTAWGGGVDLMRLVGPTRALRLLCTTQLVDHDEGRRIGLYDAVVDGDSLQQCVDRFVEPFLTLPAHVVRTFKALAVGARSGVDRVAMERIEHEHFVTNWVHDDHWAALDRFLKRPRAGVR